MSIRQQQNTQKTACPHSGLKYIPKNHQRLFLQIQYEVSPFVIVHRHPLSL